MSENASGVTIWSGHPRQESKFKGWSSLEPATKIGLRRLGWAMDIGELEIEIEYEIRGR